MTSIQETIAGWSLEDKILQASSILGVISIFFPWIQGDWLGENNMSYSGFEFFTGFIGSATFALLLLAFLIGFYPANIKTHFSQRRLDIFRLIAVTHATTLCISALSVLSILTFEYTRMEIAYGMYASLFFCLVSSLYAYWELESHKLVRPTVPTNLHTHNADISLTRTPPAPPPPHSPEEHLRHR